MTNLVNKKCTPFNSRVIVFLQGMSGLKVLTRSHGFLFLIYANLYEIQKDQAAKWNGKSYFFKSPPEELARCTPKPRIKKSKSRELGYRRKKGGRAKRGRASSIYIYIYTRVVLSLPATEYVGAVDEQAVVM